MCILKINFSTHEKLYTSGELCHGLVTALKAALLTRRCPEFYAWHPEAMHMQM